MIENVISGKSFALAAAGIAIFAALALILFLVRSFSGRGPRLPRNGRARPARLGIVDVFDLGSRRQLIIVRRDNVEHLLMIGGPNDLVIESQFIRSDSREPRVFRETVQREKEVRERELLESQQFEPAGAWPSSPASRLPPAPQLHAAASRPHRVPADLPEQLAPNHAPPFLSPGSRSRMPATATRRAAGNVSGLARLPEEGAGAESADPRMTSETARNPAPRLSPSWLRPSARRQRAEASGHAAMREDEKSLAGGDLDAVARDATAAAAEQQTANPADSATEKPASGGHSFANELARMLGRTPSQN